MKIILLTSSLSSGGAERVASTLCNAWASRGDTVTLIPTFSDGGEPFYQLDHKIELIYLASVVSGNGKTLMGYLKRFMALRKLIRDRKADVVISFLPNVNVAAILAMTGLNTPLVICERTDPAMVPIPGSLLLATKLFYRFADVLVVQTREVAAKASTIFSGVKNIKAIANPVPEEIVFLPAHAPHAGRKILLSLGRLANEKQVHFIIEAFMQIHGKHSEWDLHIYGDGPDKPALDKQVLELGLGNRVVLKGNTAQPWEVMAAADVFVITSRFEGFPNALLEAMALGLPCVSFDCPSGPREISHDGEFVLLVSPGDVNGLTQALDRLLESESLRSELGEKARQSVLARYRLSSILGQWDAMFCELNARATT